MPVAFRVLRDRDRDRCSAADEMEALLRTGAALVIVKYFGQRGDGDLGDCHEIAVALMCDLTVAGRDEGWSWVQGTATLGSEPVFHSWLEYDGWAVDASNGTVLIVPRRLYDCQVDSGTTVRRNGAQTKAWILRHRRTWRDWSREAPRVRGARQQFFCVHTPATFVGAGVNVFPFVPVVPVP